MIHAALDAGFFSPGTSILSVWLPGARPLAVKTGTCTDSVAAYRSIRVGAAPSIDTSAMPIHGPRKLIQLTDVPAKTKSACEPAVAERIAVPPPVCSELRLQSRERSDTQLPEYTTAESSSSTRDCTSKASTAIRVSLAFAFFCPATSIASVWLALTSVITVYTTAWVAVGE